MEYWETQLYKTMSRLGVKCERVFEPKFKVIKVLANGVEIYKITNNHKRGIYAKRKAK